LKKKKKRLEDNKRGEKKISDEKYASSKEQTISKEINYAK
jgi:hypothetical protein